MNITGKIIHISETQKVSETYRKREVVVETAENPKYPQTISLQLSQAKCDLIEEGNHGLNDHITADFNLRGRKWIAPSGEVKYFNTLEIWKIEKARAEQEHTKPEDGTFPF